MRTGYYDTGSLADLGGIMGRLRTGLWWLSTLQSSFPVILSTSNAAGVEYIGLGRGNGLAIRCTIRVDLGGRRILG